MAASTSRGSLKHSAQALIVLENLAQRSGSYLLTAAMRIFADGRPHRPTGPSDGQFYFRDGRDGFDDSDLQGL